MTITVVHLWTGAKRYFLDGKRISRDTAVRLMQRDDIAIIYK